MALCNFEHFYLFSKISQNTIGARALVYSLVFYISLNPFHSEIEDDHHGLFLKILLSFFSLTERPINSKFRQKYQNHPDWESKMAACQSL